MDDREFRALTRSILGVFSADGTADPFMMRNCERVALAIADAPADTWTPWERRRPRVADGPIVGRDCLGYCHLATHLVGARGPTWIEDWMPIPFAAAGEIE